jgi:hypothetical protein
VFANRRKHRTVVSSPKVGILEKRFGRFCVQASRFAAIAAAPI